MPRKVLFFFFLFLSVGAILGYTLAPKHSSPDVLAVGSSRLVSLFTSSGEQKGSDDDITNSRKNAITRTVEAVSPAVVGITVTEVREYQDPFSNFFGDDPFFRQFFGNRSL